MGAHRIRFAADVLRRAAWRATKLEALPSAAEVLVVGHLDDQVDVVPLHRDAPDETRIAPLRSACARGTAPGDGSTCPLNQDEKADIAGVRPPAGTVSRTNRSGSAGPCVC